jgi:ferredoxin
MPTFSFDGNEIGPGVLIDVEEGGPLVDICDEARAPVVFSCRSASCGTCRVEIVEGASFLEPPKRDELDVLEIFASPSNHRLACQTVARPGGGRVHLRWVND